MRVAANQIRPMRPVTAATPNDNPSLGPVGLDPVNSRGPKPNDFDSTADLDKVQAEPTPRKMPEIHIEGGPLP